MNPTHILIVDDESRIRLMLRTALESEGYSVEEAGDGQEALETIRRRVPHLMILDLSMPALDGMGVLEQLKSLPGHEKPRVIVLTAYGSILAAVKATRLGALDFLEKPITPEDLRQAVASALNEAEDQPRAEVEVPEGGYGAALGRVRRALRKGDVPTAETLLMRAADLAGKDPAYFNLLGVLHEMEGNERLARKFYGKAIAAKGTYEPAQKNMQRLYELHTYGHSDEEVTLGDEGELLTEWSTQV
ncbi:MAG: response regulator [Candidatus Latescibacteria bacterium]|nr:response regulator [Candidatus Latescibacterota bacterium]